MPCKVTAQRRLALEPLERRWMMAGDVTAAVVNGNLQIHSDDLADKITVTQLSPGEFTVTGVGGTTINGGTTPFDATGVTNNVAIKMGNGDDSVLVQNASCQGSLSIKAGNGNDTVDLFDSQVTKSVSICTGTGNDDIHLGEAPVAVTSSAATTAPSPTTLTGITVGDYLRIKTGDGNDNVSLGDTSVGDSAYIRTGNGKDHVIVGQPTTPVTTAATTPSFNVNVGRTLAIRAGNGGDTVSLDSISAASHHCSHGRRR